jgi:ABC-type sugar transport system, ATPase component
MALLELRGIEKRFGATVALGGVDLDVRAGEVHAVIGENGAGKSTLMNVLAGVFPPDSGEMIFDGLRFAPRNPHESRERGIAHIHQELSLCAHISVAENILLGIEPARNGWINRTELRRRARVLLCDFGCDYIDPDRRRGA